MESIDIETLDFEVYNREIYQENDNNGRNKAKTSSHIDALKKFKKAMNLFAEEYNKKKNTFEEEKDEEYESARINKKKINNETKF